MAKCEKCGLELPTENSEVKIQIKNRFTGTVIFESKKETTKEAVLESLKSNANLNNADLRNADLYGADLYGADLSGANLWCRIKLRKVLW